jgi:hypothetical protein
MAPTNSAGAVHTGTDATASSARTDEAPDYADLPPDLRTMVDSLQGQVENSDLQHIVSMVRQVHDIRNKVVHQLPIMADAEGMDLMQEVRALVGQAAP